MEGQPILPVRIGARDVLIVRDGTSLRAVERACPHDLADLAQGHCRGGRLHCPRHRASFNLTDGTISPGWSSRLLRRYPVRIEAGEVFVNLAEP